MAPAVTLADWSDLLACVGDHCYLYLCATVVGHWSAVMSVSVIVTTRLPYHSYLVTVIHRLLSS